MEVNREGENDKKNIIFNLRIYYDEPKLILTITNRSDRDMLIMLYI